MTRLTDEQMDALGKYLDDPQVRGEWHARGTYVYRSNDARDRRQVCRVPAADMADPYWKHPVAAFIARARRHMPSMLAEIRSRRAADLTADEVEALGWLQVQARAIQYDRVKAGSDCFPNPARALAVLDKLLASKGGR